MHVYKELTQPTTVTHSLACNFIDANESCLIVVRGNSLLEVYNRVVVQEEVVNENKTSRDEEREAEESAMVEGGDSFIGAGMALEQSKEQNTSKLQLIGQFPLHGFVVDIHSVKTMATEPGIDCLLIAFKHAKMTLVSWDTLNEKIATISLHLYEKDLMESHFVDQDFAAYFRVDPQNSCSCMMYQKDQLAFLPFVQRDELDETTMSDEDKVYRKSFLVHSTRLDQELTNIVDFAFLYEYREPTMALIYQPTLTWTGLLPRAKDTVRYLVLSLDTQNSSSTPIISIQNLPHDISQVLPLKDPVSGSMLVGPNMLIHIDSSGKTTAVAVNSLAKHTTDLQLVDQSSLEIKLEGCKLAQLDGTNGELLMVLSSGELYSVKFKVEGRRVYGFTVSPHSNPKEEWMPRPSCMSMIPNTSSVFVGSRGGAAQLLTLRRQRQTPGAVDSAGKVAVASTDELDDIYGDDDKEIGHGGDSSTPMSLVVDDRMPNYGPITSMAIGRPRVSGKTVLRTKDPKVLGYDIVASTGVGAQGSLSVFQPNLRPNIVSDLTLKTADKIWSLCTSSVVAGNEVPYDNFVVTSDHEASTLYIIKDRQLKNYTKESKYNGQRTIGIGTVSGGTAVIQVMLDSATIYDAEFKHAGKKVKFKENALYVSFNGPYALVTFENGECVLLQCSTTKTGKPTLDMVKQFPDNAICGALSSSTIMNKVKHDKTPKKRARNGREIEEENSDSEENTIAVCLTGENDLEIYQIKDQENKAKLRGLHLLPDVLYDGYEPTEPSVNASPATIVQVLLAKLGDNVHQEEYLFLLTDTNELHLYKAIVVEEQLRFLKVNDQLISIGLQGEEFVNVHPIEIGEYKGVFITGTNPHVVIKGHRSPPRAHKFGKSDVISVASFNTDAIYKGLIVIDPSPPIRPKKKNDDLNTVRICTLTEGFDYTDSSWPVKQIRFGCSINNICYHEKGKVYAMSTIEDVDFDYKDEDGEPITGLLEGIPKAKQYQSSLKLVSPLTWTVIDEHEALPGETIMTLKSVSLLVSERQKRYKEVLAYGTSIMRGEDLAAKGSFYIYDAVDIVPEPGRPETDRKLKELTKEDVKGAVTTLCEVDGHLLIAQGQKVVVRNLQEDNSIMPVAFLDLNMYIVEAKNVKNFLILGDALSSVWLAGFGQEPYRMNTMGKDLRKIQVSSSEFVVSDGSLSLIVADYDRTLHVLSYEPEDPASLAGQRLMPKGDFFTGRVMQTMFMIPTLKKGEVDESELIPICGSDDGTLSTMVPLTESDFRRLFVVQQQIVDKEEHTAALNPRMNRDTNNTSGEGVQRNVLDYTILRRFIDLDIEKRYQYSRKAGQKGEDEVWNCLNRVEYRLVHL